MLFTIDTNCIIDLERDSEFAPPLRELVAAHRRGDAEVAVPVVAASEVQRNGLYLENFGQFEERLAQAGLDELPLIHPIAYWGISFYGLGYLADDAMVQLERKIHAVLHPSVPFEYLSRTNHTTGTEEPDPKWRNAKCDTQALWSHVYHKRDVFVTRDENFLKKTKLAALAALGAGQILIPRDAAVLLKPAA
jgi:hypothetical protein